MDIKSLAEQRIRNRDPIYGAEWVILGAFATGLAVMWLFILAA